MNPAELTADAIMRELGHLASVLRRAVRSVEGGSRTLEILVHLSMHESAIADGFASHALSQAELAERLGIRPQSIGPAIAQLEGEGLVVRVPRQADRRAHELQLTDAGRAAAQEARDCQQLFAEKTLGALTEEERAQLAGLIVKLKATLEQD